MIPRSSFIDKARPWAWVLFLSNLIVILGTGLAHDEAYYWTFARRLAWGYFDHPPMVAWWIALTSWIPGELGVRLTFLSGLQASAALLAQMAPESRRWQVWAGFNIFPLLAFAGIFAIPDGALVAMSVFWLWALERSLARDDVGHAILMGIASALLLYSKYHGVLFLAATILAVPRLCLRPTFWLALAVALLMFAPHLWWQHTHGYPTLRYHFVDRPSAPAGVGSIALFAGLQLLLPGVMLGPLLWRSWWRARPADEFERALKVIALFVPLFFLVSAFSKKFEANWTVAAGLPLLLLVVRRDLWPTGRWSRRGLIVVTGIVLIAKVLLVIPPEWHGLRRARELHGWKSWARDLRTSVGPECAIAANRYQFAGKLSFYLREDVPSLNVGTRLNQFELWDARAMLGARPICWITNREDLFPGRDIPTPTLGSLRLVEGIPLDVILSHKRKAP